MKLYRLAEAALIADLGSTLRQWAHRGIVELTIVDGVPLVSHDELERVVRERMPDKLHLLKRVEFFDCEPLENCED